MFTQHARNNKKFVQNKQQFSGKLRAKVVEEEVEKKSCVCAAAHNSYFSFHIFFFCFSLNLSFRFAYFIGFVLCFIGEQCLQNIICALQFTAGRLKGGQKWNKNERTNGRTEYLKCEHCARHKTSEKKLSFKYMNRHAHNRFVMPKWESTFRLCQRWAFKSSLRNGHGPRDSDDECGWRETESENARWISHEC